jgi:hypothetical protein
LFLPFHQAKGVLGDPGEPVAAYNLLGQGGYERLPVNEDTEPLSDALDEFGDMEGVTGLSKYVNRKITYL